MSDIHNLHNDLVSNRLRVSVLIDFPYTFSGLFSSETNTVTLISHRRRGS